MARVTINDCLDKVGNHFELILVAAVRAKEILGGKAPNIPRKGSTAGVIALREIAECAIDFKKIQESFSTIFNDKDQDKNSNALEEDINNEGENLLVIEETEGDKLLSSD